MSYYDHNARLIQDLESETLYLFTANHVETDELVALYQGGNRQFIDDYQFVGQVVIDQKNGELQVWEELFLMLGSARAWFIHPLHEIELINTERYERNHYENL